ncbi:hypothetical protein HDU96_000871 [Phlyctochytrium bullatum]|nr:hypothetical protein HDU96_000871 [Phlyctochytrium bullatum]
MSPTGGATGAVPLWQNITGIALAVLSGVLIGASVVFTKRGLIQSGSREEGREHAYLKNPLWWVGMVMMGLGEVANFGAYSFTAAILVTPLGALSVVITAILSSLFLNEKLSFPGKIGCAQCVIGSIIIVINAPSSSTTQTVDEFFNYVLAPGFLSFSAIVILAQAFLIFYCEKRYARKTPMVYIMISSLTGPYLTLSTQGFGTSVVFSIRHWNTDQNQFLRWPLYPLFAFMVVAIISQIHYLNRAYSLYSTAVVTPIFYVTFTSATLLGSAILYQGFPVESWVAGLSIVMGFLVIVGGVALLFEYSMQLLAQEAALVANAVASAASHIAIPASSSASTFGHTTPLPPPSADRDAPSLRSVSRAGDAADTDGILLSARSPKPSSETTEAMDSPHHLDALDPSHPPPHSSSSSSRLPLHLPLPLPLTPLPPTSPSPTPLLHPPATTPPPPAPATPDPPLTDADAAAPSTLRARRRRDPPPSGQQHCAIQIVDVDAEAGGRDRGVWGGVFRAGRGRGGGDWARGVVATAEGVGAGWWGAVWRRPVGSRGADPRSAGSGGETGGTEEGVGAAEGSAETVVVEEHAVVVRAGSKDKEKDGSVRVEG